uniref:Uncharacterized protein n=1 Tax=Ralstonia solanacearum TaxID=305 RepID=A0A0S4WJM3_RALSL|nr:protein of unknown function [Ralstonia solanacearum]
MTRSLVRKLHHTFDHVEALNVAGNGSL